MASDTGERGDRRAALAVVFGLVSVPWTYAFVREAGEAGHADPASTKQAMTSGARQVRGRFHRPRYRGSAKPTSRPRKPRATAGPKA